MLQMSARDFLESSLRDPEGYFLVFPTEEEVKRFRLSCYQCRSRLRRKNEIAFIDEPGYIAHTAFDGLRFDIREEVGHWLLVAKHIDFNLEHTLHGPLTKEMLERLASGQPILPLIEGVGAATMDEASEPPTVDEATGVDNG